MRYLRVSTVRDWLSRRRIGDDVGMGLCFRCSARMEFEEYICWRRL